jgi:hypothetical protein
MAKVHKTQVIQKTVLFLVSLVVATCKTSGLKTSSIKDYRTPRPGEIRINWYTTRLSSTDPASDGSAYSGDTSHLLPEKGVLYFDTPPLYEIGKLNLAVPTRQVDDAMFNSELINGAFDSNLGLRATFFVHGYNHTFENAIQRGAEIFAALENPGPGINPFRSKPVIFDWPSQGKSVDDPNLEGWLATGTPFFARPYLQDRISADNSIPKFAQLIGITCGNGDRYRETSIIAHSMGARLTVETLAALSRNYQSQFPIGTPLAKIKSSLLCPVRHLVLASGDMEFFRFRDLLPDLLLVTDHITLYVNGTLIEQILPGPSAMDIPLALSKVINFFSAGEFGPRIGHDSFFISRLNSAVDVVAMRYLPNADANHGHMNIFSHPSVLRDLTLTLQNQKNLNRIAIGERKFILQ